MNQQDKKPAAKGFGIESLEERRLMSVAFGSNLVLNPGAETYTGVATGYNVITPTDWTATGDPTVAVYGKGYAKASAIREPQGSGKAFFTGGPDTSGTRFHQSIDLSSIAGQIDAGQINFDMSAALGGFSYFNANAQLYVIFDNAAGNEISSAVTGTVLAIDRNNASKLLYRTQTGLIPATTRSAEVLIQFNRPAPSGYNTAYADNVRFLVYTNLTSTAGITPAVVSSTLPASGASGLKVAGGLDLSLTNTSSSKNVGPVTVSLLASTDGLVDSNSILLNSVKHSYTFGAGQIKGIDIPAKSLVNVPPGTYTIFARTTDHYGTVDTTTSGPVIVVGAPAVVLAAVVGSVTPATVSAGRGISFTLTVQNSGNISSTGLASIVIGLSSDGATVAVPLTTERARLTVAPGDRPVVLHLKVKTPAGLTGVFVPLVTYTQAGDSVTAVGAFAVAVSG